MKPFKPPTLLNRAKVEPSTAVANAEPPAKKRRISQESENDKPEAPEIATVANRSQKSARSFSTPQRSPLVSVQSRGKYAHPEDASEKRHYNILWRRFTAKKNKTWDGDGVLTTDGAYALLQDISGKEIGRAPCKGPLMIGSALSISGREIEVESTISREDFLAGRPFIGRSKSSAPASLKQSDNKKKVLPQIQAKTDRSAAPAQANRPAPPRKDPTSLRTMFKAPLLNNTVLEAKKNSSTPVPRHDPNAEGALVMTRPKAAPRGKQIVDVVVDPLLTKNLREHQRTGVAFMYECVMGMKGHSGEGAILADEMGLGKTLQTIALIWTLLKQNPIYEDGPVIKKALIVCPVTLVNNWRKEFAKWLGRERIGVFVAGNKNTRLTDFTLGRAYSVMIIGYERLRTVQADLQKGPGIDLVIADEGHRLKTAQNKSAQAIKSLNTERRIILSGTPLQNDLTEFYTMVDFVNPGLLNKYTIFKREFETHILKSRQPEASAADIEKGEAKSEELAEITSTFILRRTAEILSKYLPPKTEYVVFCRPTNAQASVYRSIIGSSIFNAALGSPALSLELINVLKKVCNSPTLLMRSSGKGDDEPIKPELLECIPSQLLRSPGASGKLQVLDSLLHTIRTTTPDEKVVLVSNYTSTLDLLATLLASLSYTFLRLDGSTPPAKRQELVDRFNRTPAAAAFAFLLSAKAGGTGLNLIGASRCVLFDLDWNPATDLQAMARVHRDGQRRPVFIYRLLTQGALDEKIFQRQVAKTGLAERIVDGKKAGVGAFTRAELRDLFRFDDAAACPTHELLGCACGGLGTPVEDDRGDEIGDELPVGEDAGACDEELLEERSILVSTGFSSAREFEAREEESRRDAGEGRNGRRKGKMLSLMQYTHFDPVHVSQDDLAGPKRNTESGRREINGVQRCVDDDYDDNDQAADAPEVAELSTLDTAIEDTVLKSVLREDGGRIGYVFTKVSS